MSQNHTFTADGSLPANWETNGRYSEIILGKDGQNFPSTSVKIQKITQDNGIATLRSFTAAPDNRSILLETTPRSTIAIAVAGTSGNFYVEINDLKE